MLSFLRGGILDMMVFLPRLGLGSLNLGEMISLLA